MFYATQIQSVHTGGAVDVQGRNLIFIGYMPVKAGDTVYTDGRVIFGNAPPKGSPDIFDDPHGIPVLGERDSTSLEELRGYFTPRGKYKRYEVAHDDWITNSDKIFNHGNEFVGTNKVIDANVADNGDKLIVTGGLYRDSHTFQSTYVEIPLKDSRTWWDGAIPYYRVNVLRQTFGSDDYAVEKTPAQLFIENKSAETLDLEPYAKDVEARALSCAADIMAQSFEEQVGGRPYMTLEELSDIDFEYYNTNFPEDADWIWLVSGASNEVAQSRPENPFIAYSSAHLMTCDVSDKGFKGIVFASAYGYCFPHIQPRFSIAWYSDSGRYSYRAIFNARGKPFVSYFLYEWKCVPFGVSCFYEICDDGTITPIACRNFGGINSDVAVVNDEDGYLIDRVGGAPTGLLANIEKKRHIELLAHMPNFDLPENKLFPVGDGFYRMDKFGRLSFFDKEKNLVADNIPVHDDFYHIEIAHGGYVRDTVFNDKPYLNCKVYTSDGKIDNAYMVSNGVAAINDGTTIIQAEQGTLPLMDGYYIKYPTGIFEPLQFTPLFFQFKDKSCLYGVKGGKLYHKTDEGTELVGDGLKNFRLRELKNIRKAKK